ncbi:hypothetical protein A2415_00135 [candidate division WWE3 bacterium RIFOXYC1_FULL_39_7]|uniref:Nudix hydrolase domain-containing protein n=1 Tax=candidate division WWE3 bacterium RIFOXYC1_FULL_39_7 TaxID=1802643 RepID=A0A1F4WKM5_UNCKA|nr:MAG: hypothetical protein A2415_00135 [candidate division WWE3 bacterium RIFOXYC1_FULL_39_7]
MGLEESAGEKAMPDYYVVLPFVVVLVWNHEGDVLIGRHQKLERKPYPGFWDLPGGKMKPREKPEECARREILEELDVRLVKINLFDVYHHSEDLFGVRLPKNRIPSLGLCYTGDIIGVPMEAEQLDVHFATESELLGLIATMTPWTYHFLKKHFGW